MSGIRDEVILVTSQKSLQWVELCSGGRILATRTGKTLNTRHQLSLSPLCLCLSTWVCHRVRLSAAGVERSSDDTLWPADTHKINQIKMMLSKHTPSLTVHAHTRSLHLCDVLVERWRQTKLGQQVEEGGADGVNAAAVEHWQTLMTGQRQLLTSQSQERRNNQSEKSSLSLYYFYRRCLYLQSQDQSDQVHHHLLIGQFHTEYSQQGDEGLVVTPPTAFLLTGEVDVPVETLGMLHAHTCTHTAFKLYLPPTDTRI